MTTFINASTSSGLVVNSDNSGNILLQYNGQSAPAFSVYQTASQTLSSNVVTKLNFDTEEFDTNNNFASGRFTPTVGGYYMLTGHTQPNSTYTAGICAFVKNGSVYKYSAFNQNGTASAQAATSCLIFLNGTTDYVEFHASFVDGQPIATGPQMTWFQGCLLRGT